MLRPCPYCQRFYKKSACFVLRAVAKHSVELARTVIESGGLNALVLCLEEFDPNVKESAAWAIGYVARHSPELAQSVVDAGQLRAEGGEGSEYVSMDENSLCVRVGVRWGRGKVVVRPRLSLCAGSRRIPVDCRGMLHRLSKSPGACSLFASFPRVLSLIAAGDSRDG